MIERENSQEEFDPTGASLFTLLLAEQRYLPASVSCTSHKTMEDVTNPPQEVFVAGVTLVVTSKPSYSPATSSVAGRRVHVTFGNGTPYAVQVSRTECEDTCRSMAEGTTTRIALSICGL